VELDSPDLLPEPAENPALPDRPEAQEDDVRPLPVLAEAQVIERPQPASLPAVVAAGTLGFVAGVAAWMLVRVLRRSRRSPAVRGLRKRRERGIEIAGTRSFLVDVHLLKR
jgi:hypothetical protein